MFIPDLVCVLRCLPIGIAIHLPPLLLFEYLNRQNSITNQSHQMAQVFTLMTHRGTGIILYATRVLESKSVLAVAY